MFESQLDEINPEPRLPCVLLLDTSYSMSGTPLAEMLAGLNDFATDIKSDQLVRKHVELSIVSFGGVVQLATPFVEAQSSSHPP